MAETVKRKRAKPKKRESEFCTDLVKELKRKGWAHKLPDSPFQQPREGQNIFSPPKKFDILCCSKRAKGKLIAIEAKMWELKSEPTRERIIKTLRPTTKCYEGQYDTLKAIAVESGRSFIALKKYVPRASRYYLIRCMSEGIDAGEIMTFHDVRELASEIIFQY
jgi:hypothetical protein